MVVVMMVRRHRSRRDVDFLDVVVLAMLLRGREETHFDLEVMRRLFMRMRLACLVCLNSGKIT